MKEVNHPRIGLCQVLIEAEIPTKNQTKYYALIRAKADAYRDEKKLRTEFVTGNMTHHYILWGNTPEFNKMGITQCLTNRLRACTGTSSIRRFFEIIQTADHIEFKQ